MFSYIIQHSLKLISPRLNHTDSISSQTVSIRSYKPIPTSNTYKTILAILAVLIVPQPTGGLM